MSLPYVRRATVGDSSARSVGVQHATSTPHPLPFPTSPTPRSGRPSPAELARIGSRLSHLRPTVNAAIGLTIGEQYRDLPFLRCGNPVTEQPQGPPRLPRLWNSRTCRPRCGTPTASATPPEGWTRPSAGSPRRSGSSPRRSAPATAPSSSWSAPTCWPGSRRSPSCWASTSTPRWRRYADGCPEVRRSPVRVRPVSDVRVRMAAPSGLAGRGGPAGRARAGRGGGHGRRPHAPAAVRRAHPPDRAT